MCFTCVVIVVPTVLNLMIQLGCSAEYLNIHITVISAEMIIKRIDRSIDKLIVNNFDTQLIIPIIYRTNATITVATFSVLYNSNFFILFAALVGQNQQCQDITLGSHKL